jgi:hypothetical protein
VLLVPLIIALAIGLSLVYTVAFLQGIVSSGGTFERTPKAGDEHAPERGPRYRSTRSALVLVELALAAGHLYFAREAWVVGNVPYGVFFAAVAASFGWVGLATLASSGVGHARSTAAK